MIVSLLVGVAPDCVRFARFDRCSLPHSKVLLPEAKSYGTLDDITLFTRQDINKECTITPLCLPYSVQRALTYSDQRQIEATVNRTLVPQWFPVVKTAIILKWEQ